MDIQHQLAQIKKQQRKEFRQKRKLIPPYKKKLNALKLVKQCRLIPHFTTAKHIAIYLANDHEIDPSFLIHSLWQNNKTCYLPVLDKQKTNQLRFLPYIKDQLLTKNIFSIKEPYYQKKNSRVASQLDLIFLPLLAFDCQGHRLGMGGGYYDRSLAFLKQGRKSIKPSLVGIAYSCQQIEQLTPESWDIPLSYIVTEKKLIRT